MLMRLDKFLGVTGKATRSEAKTAVRRGRVLVNGIAPKSSDVKIDPERDTVSFDGVTVSSPVNALCGEPSHKTLELQDAELQKRCSVPGVHVFCRDVFANIQAARS